MQKKFTHFLLVISLLISFTTAKAQVIFSETFDNISGPTAGGAGTYVFPNGWLLANVDNRTPSGTVAYINDAWERREDFANNVSDSAAFSTSWYGPAGSADDWMWTPAINLTGTLPISLSWSAVTYDPDYRDGYEVRIMTVPPTGSTGNIGNMVTSSTVLFSIPEENATWTNRKASLSAFAGQQVYIGFRNNSTDKFILLIDNVKVEVEPEYDAQTSKEATYEYQQIPFNQVSTIALGASIKNGGSKAITNVNLKAEIYDSVNTMVYSALGTSVVNMPAGTESAFTIPSWSPSEPGIYTIKYFPVLDQTDQNPLNDTISKTLHISDSVFARDNGNVVGSLGIGASNGGYLGQSFTINNEVYLTSVTANFTRGYKDEKYAFVLWNTTGTEHKPNVIVASTDTLLYPSTDPLLTTVPIHGGKFLLAPGTYVVTAVEFDSTLALSQTDQTFTTGTVWVKWPSIPSGDWANAESFGASFGKSFYLRLNINTASAVPVRLISFTGAATSEGNKLQWKVGEQSGIEKYVIERSNDAIHFESIGSVDAIDQTTYTYQFNDANTSEDIHFYRLKIVENNKDNYSNIIRIENKSKYKTGLWPLPAKNFVTLQSNNSKLLNTRAILQTIDGKTLSEMVIDQLPFKIDISKFAKGMYFLRLSDDSVLKIIKE